MRTTHQTIRQVGRTIRIVALITGIGALVLAGLFGAGLKILEVVTESGLTAAYPLLAAAGLAVLLSIALVDLCLERTLLRAGLWIDHVLEPCLLKAGLAAPDPATTLLDTNRWLGDLRDVLTGGRTRTLIGLPVRLAVLAAIAAVAPLIGTIAVACYMVTLAMALLGAAWLARRNRDRVQSARAVRRGVVSAAANGHALVGLGLADHACRTGAALNRRWIAAAFRAGRLETTLVVLDRALLSTALVALAAIVLVRVQSGDITAPVALLIIVTLAIVLSPLAATPRAILDGATALGAWRRLSDVSLDETARRLFTAPETEDSQPWMLTLRDVDFGYPGAAPILERTSLVLERGDVIALHGAPGSGKSSVAALLAGGRAPSAGLVLAGDTPVGRRQSTTSRPSVGWLMEEPLLLEGTVAQNIARFTEDDIGEVHVAIRRAGVAGVIATLEHGLETRIGSDGRSLSLRQRRAIALARAIYGRPPFLVLDEPETGLDAGQIEDLAAGLLGLRQAGTGIALITRHPDLLALADRSFLLSGRTLVPMLEPVRHWPALAANDGSAADRQAG